MVPELFAYRDQSRQAPRRARVVSGWKTACWHANHHNAVHISGGWNSRGLGIPQAPLEIQVLLEFYTNMLSVRRCLKRPWRPWYVILELGWRQLMETNPFHNSGLYQQKASQYQRVQLNRIIGCIFFCLPQLIWIVFLICWWNLSGLEAFIELTQVHWSTFEDSQFPYWSGAQCMWSTLESYFGSTVDVWCLVGTWRQEHVEPRYCFHVGTHNFSALKPSEVGFDMLTYNIVIIHYYPKTTWSTRCMYQKCIHACIWHHQHNNFKE